MPPSSSTHSHTHSIAPKQDLHPCSIGDFAVYELEYVMVPCLIARDTHARWETPRGRYDECSSKFPLVWNQVYRTSRSWDRVWRCWWWNLVRRSTWDFVANVKPAHNTTKILCPNVTVRLSISLACWKQRIRRIVWKMMFACRKM